MRPRRTLLVVINKKVEWGILSVADIAVKWVNFTLHRSGGPRGRSWPPATRWPRRWIIGFLRDLERLTGQRVIRCEHLRLVKDRFFDRFRLVLGRKSASGI